MSKASLDQIIHRVDDVPVLPHVVQQIMLLTEDPNSTVKDIENVVAIDQGLTAKILKLANSAYYGYPRRISTITEATVLLGFQTLRSLTISAAVSTLLNKELPGYRMDKGELWHHSQTCAVAARLIAKKLKKKNAEQVYIAGLLHDIGKVILSCYMNKRYNEVLQEVQNHNISFVQAEESIIGFNHAQIGSKLAEKWHLPIELVDAIAHHHNPELSSDSIDTTSIVHIADAITMTMGIGLGVDGLGYPISDHAFQRLGICETIDIESFISEISDIISDSDTYIVL